VRPEGHGVEVSGRDGIQNGGGDERLAATGATCDTGGEVDGGAEVVATPLDDRSVVDSRAWFGESGLFEGLVKQPAYRVEPTVWPNSGEHHCVADRLNQFYASEARSDRGDLSEVVDKVSGGLVAMDIGERSETGEIDKRNRAISRHG
jgi:hypothetical protein